MNKISVIMPAFNCATYIDNAMVSVLHQTESDLELIVVNDGSIDGTQEVVKACAERDSRVKLINQPNSGKPAIARNRGLEHATGEFVCFLDGDDFYSPDKIKGSLEVLQKHSSANTVFHDVTFTSEAGSARLGSYLHSVPFAPKVLSASKRLGNDTFLCDERSFFWFMCINITTIYTSSILIHRIILTQGHFLFPEDLIIGEDVDLWFRLVGLGGVAYIDRPLSFYRQHASSVTKRKEEMRKRLLETIS
jgi:glycosyltransferase involved in cell wall biosynthesis